MKTRPSLLLGWTLAGLTLIAFFLPWARLAPEATATNVLGLANTLATGEDDIISSYLWMKRAEARAALRRPAEGTSGYQLAADPAQAGGGAGPALIELLQLGPWIRGVIALPLLALTLAILLSLRQPPPRLLLATAALLVAAYGAIRWKLNSLYTERLLLHIDLNLGLWIFLYAALLLALLAALRALLPEKWGL